jgi:hypothetical protein
LQVTIGVWGFVTRPTDNYTGIRVLRDTRTRPLRSVTRVR